MATKRPTKKPTKLKAGKKKKLNKWLILGGVAAVAVIGVVVVRFSSASTITFLRTPHQFTSRFVEPVLYKRNNNLYAPVGEVNRYDLNTIVSASEMARSRYICTKVTNFTNSVQTAYIQLRPQKNNLLAKEVTRNGVDIKPRETRQFCTQKIFNLNTTVSVYTGNSFRYNDQHLGTTGVYGRKY